MDHLRLLTAFAVLVGSPVAAQDGSAFAGLPACVTNAGPDGEMIGGFYGLIYAPVVFDRVRALGETGSGLTVISEMRDGLGVLAKPEFVPVDAAPSLPPTLNAAGEPMVRVEFIAGSDTVVHACAVHIVSFDPKRYDLTKLQTGNCDLKLVAGLPQLRVGHLQVWRTPETQDGAFVSPILVMDLTSLDSDLVMPSGNSPGFALLGWDKKRQDGTVQISLCPFEIEAAVEGDVARPIDDQYLCKDPQGKPLLLAPGEVATVQAHNVDGSVFETEEWMVQSTGIAKRNGFDKATQGAIVLAVAAGSTSVALLGRKDGHVTAFVCEVVVE